MIFFLQANAFRNAHKIYVNGSDVPDAVASFADLYEHYNLPSYLRRNVASAGYLKPTPIQMQAIPLMLHGREVLACAPTGSGKTAAFIIPILVHLKEPAKVGFRAVIVSPTRELAQQTYRECSRLCVGSGFKVHVLTKAKASANSFGPSSSQRFDILVTTPSRLVHMLSQEPPAIQLNSVEWLVLDEADKLFEDGPSDSGFRNQVAQIYSACDNPKVKHALFSATLGQGWRSSATPTSPLQSGSSSASRTQRRMQ
ncbi:Probable ATP-dependent RNA helicase DDX52 [Geodia barretti]|uniref:ATP-dependent RNA helicase n=1 Tax=Geodia barretti TaxID=519541 RepID=A0AA35SDB6_GEOBA|nr:Probable ATP-dependent RNA helicase DDX52 [Geodia barretti]